MEDKKDINQYTSAMAQKKHHIELFSKDNYSVFVYKKTEKFSTAIYLVSDLMSDKEPLKWQLRTCAMSLMTLIAPLVNVSVVEKHTAIEGLKLTLIEVISLFEIGHDTHLVSDMNFGLLRKEFLSFISEMTKPTVGISTTGVSFGQDFFTVPYVPMTLASTADFGTTQPRKTYGQKSIKDKKIAPVSLSDNSSVGVVSATAKTPKEETKDNRREIILKLLSEKTPLMIKDFSYVIKGCSEKTIQRELLSMVASGVLKKEGERRWSRYSRI